MKIFAPSLTLALCVATLAFSVLPSMAQSGAAKKSMPHHATKMSATHKMAPVSHRHKAPVGKATVKKASTVKASHKN